MERSVRLFIWSGLAVLSMNIIAHIFLPSDINPETIFKISLIVLAPSLIGIIFDIIDFLSQNSLGFLGKAAILFVVAIAMFCIFAVWVNPELAIFKILSDTLSSIVFGVIILAVCFFSVNTIIEIAGVVAESKDGIKKAGEGIAIGVFVALILCLNIVVGLLATPFTSLSAIVGILAGFELNKYLKFLKATETIFFLAVAWGIAGVTIECVTGLKRIVRTSRDVEKIQPMLFLVFASDAASMFTFGVLTFVARKYLFS